MRKCPKCGNENPDFINICTNCGTDLGYTDRHYPSDDEYEYVDDEYIETQDMDKQEDNNEITDVNENNQEPNNQPADNENIINQQSNPDGSQFIQYNQQQPNNMPTFNQQQMDYQNQTNNNEKKGFFDSNNKMKWALIGIILLIIVVAVALYYPTYQEQQDRQEFLDLMSNYAVDSNNEGAQLLTSSQNMSSSDYGQMSNILENITNYTSNETKKLQDYNKSTDNQTRHEFIGLEVTYLNHMGDMCNHAKQLLQLEQQYDTGEITASEYLDKGYPLLNELTNDSYAMLDAHQKVSDYIDQHEDLKTELDDAGIYNYFHENIGNYDTLDTATRSASST